MTATKFARLIGQILYGHRDLAHVLGVEVVHRPAPALHHCRSRTVTSSLSPAVTGIDHVESHGLGACGIEPRSDRLNDRAAHAPCVPGERCGDHVKGLLCVTPSTILGTSTALSLCRPRRRYRGVAGACCAGRAGRFPTAVKSTAPTWNSPLLQHGLDANAAKKVAADRAKLAAKARAEYLRLVGPAYRRRQEGERRRQGCSAEGDQPDPYVHRLAGREGPTAVPASSTPHAPAL